MAFENIIVETHERVALIRLNRPKAYNALNSALMRELVEALRSFDADEGIGCIVLTGNDKAFAAGADIKGMVKHTPASMLLGGPIEGWERIQDIHKPVIAAVSGFALGGGCEVAMACDMIIASETAVFGQPEINLGIIPGAGGSQRLVRAVGKALAMEIILNDRRLSAKEALQHGLINHVYSVESYLDEALKLAAEIGARAPLALRMAKECVNKAFELSLAEGLDVERRNFYMLFSTDDQQEGMQAFIEKRPAEWQGK